MIKKADFITSIVNVKDLPNDGFPHILLLGRSNVGKSSLINALTNRKRLARISGTPGKTITLNLYLLNDTMYLVDAPGYGYAKRSKAQTYQFLMMIKDFITGNAQLKKIFLLIDFKVGPTKDDLELYENLQVLALETIIVSTKYDKVKSSLRLKQKQTIQKLFPAHQKIYFTSSEKRVGLTAVTQEILNVT